MLKIKYNPGPLTLNGPAFEAYAARVVLDGHEVLVLAGSRDVAAGVAEGLSDTATPAVHVFLGQPPWYMNETREFALEDMLPTAPPPPARRTIKKGFF